MHAERLLLQREPDAIRAGGSLFEEPTPVYLALMLGPLVAAGTVVWNLASVRRYGWAALVLVLGVVGSVGCSLLMVVGNEASGSISVGVFVSQLVAVALGGGLFLLQRPFVRGHRLLRGGFFPAGQLLLGAFVLQLAAWDVAFALMHPLLALLRAAS